MSMFSKTAAALLLACASLSAQAGLISVTDRGTFNSLGSIAYNSNFSDFGTGFTLPGDTFTRGDVTYTSGANLTVGSGTGYSIGQSQTVMSYNYWSPITATIAGSYTLFGFDAAVTSGLSSITIMTNLASYTYSALSLANGAPNFTFEGFETTGLGEYFTGFIFATQGSSFLPGVTNVAVGNTNVPEPGTWALLLTGVGIIAALGRRRRGA